MKPIKIGLEIECLVNEDLSIARGEYHHGVSIPSLSGWKAENDSSIHNKPNDKWFGNPTEFVSKIVTNKDDFFKLLENFQDYFIKKGKPKLSDALIFNSSCGAHIHFSMKGMKFRTKTIWKVFRETRNLFIKLLKESDIVSKKEIFAQYYRSYARKCTRTNYTQSRMSEFNFESEWENKGMEWRSINLNQVKSWKDFFTLFEIVWTCLNFLTETAEKYSEKRTITVKPQVKELKHLKSAEFKSKVSKNSSFKEEEIILNKERLFSKEGEPPESKEMVKLRLKHLSNIEHYKKNTLSLSTNDVAFAKKYLRQHKILILDDKIIQPYLNSTDDLSYTLPSLIGLLSLESALISGCTHPTLNNTKRLLLSGQIYISRDIIGNRCLAFKDDNDDDEDNELITVTPADLPTFIATEVDYE